MASWGERAIAAVTQLPENRMRADNWIAHLESYLANMGGIMGDQPRDIELPPSRALQSFEPDYFPRRDERFDMQWNFVNPQRQVSLNENVPLDERILALMCRRIVDCATCIRPTLPCVTA